MKKEEIPQDKCALENFTKEVCYAVDEKGNYTAELSQGWNVKADALNVTWADIEDKIQEAKKKVLAKEASPVLYFMTLKLMDLTIVSDYTGFWKWTIKRHLKPEHFAKLSDKKLQKYADLFEVPLSDLKQFNIQ